MPGLHVQVQAVGLLWFYEIRFKSFALPTLSSISTGVTLHYSSRGHE